MCGTEPAWRYRQSLRELHVPFDSKVATLPYGGSVADRCKRLFRIYLTFHLRGHRDELPVAFDSLRHPDSQHGSPSLTSSSALSSTLVHRRGDYHLCAVVFAL